MPLKIVVVACTGGAGHLRAGEALAETARKLRPRVAVEFWDVLNFTPGWFRRLYAESYLHMVNRTPEIWGYLYARTEQQPHRNPAVIQAFDRVNYNRYWKALQTARPDILLCTHFLPYLSIARRLPHWKDRPLVCAATTDFDVHRLWVDPVVDRYYVFHRESQWQLASKGVNESDIIVSGIPVHPAFTRRRSRRSMRKTLGLPSDRKTILVVAGGFGVGRVREIAASVKEILEDLAPRRFNLVVVCGRNQEALTQIRSMKPGTTVHLQALGFVENMHDWMDAADLLISKSGGLTSSEALAKKLPMIVVDPIPGQESRNADLLVEQGAAWKAIDLAHLGYKLRQALLTSGALPEASRQAAALSRPHAAKTILTDAIRLAAAKQR